MSGVIMPLCNRMFCCIFGWYFYIEIRLKYEKNILLSRSRAFSLSTPTFSLSTRVGNSEATCKKATKCNKLKTLVNKSEYYVGTWKNFVQNSESVLNNCNVPPVKVELHWTTPNSALIWILRDRTRLQSCQIVQL